MSNVNMNSTISSRIGFTLQLWARLLFIASIVNACLIIVLVKLTGVNDGGIVRLIMIGLFVISVPLINLVLVLLWKHIFSSTVMALSTTLPPIVTNARKESLEIPSTGECEINDRRIQISLHGDSERTLVIHKNAFGEDQFDKIRELIIKHCKITGDIPQK